MQPALTYLSATDPHLKKLIARYPEPNITQHTNYYDELVSSIISQQLSVKAADSIRSRFIALFDGKFPTPSQILNSDIEQFRSAGLSRPKASYIYDLASRIESHEVIFDELDNLTNDEIIAKLTAVKGIGVWTAQMFLMFCMARLDVLPTGDLGIRNGIARLYGLVSLPDHDQITHIALENNWHPYETIACWYIWQSLDNAPSPSRHGQ